MKEVNFSRFPGKHFFAEAFRNEHKPQKLWSRMSDREDSFCNPFSETANVLEKWYFFRHIASRFLFHFYLYFGDDA
ncbi:unnamed protein product, partial [Larinioides sclopetarius]